MPKTKKTVVEGSSPKVVVDSKMTAVSQDSPKPVLSKRERIEKIMREELRMVKGRFKFYKCPGGNTMVHVRKYSPKKVPEFKEQMYDGKVYEVPLYVARFLNGIDAQAGDLNRVLNTCSYPVHAWAWPKGQANPNPGQVMGDTVIPILSVGKREQRVGFESLAFGVEDMGEDARTA